MHSPSDPWLAFTLVALFALLLFLQVKFPNRSKATENTALAAAIVLFFLVCNAFLTPRRLPVRPADPITAARAAR